MNILGTLTKDQQSKLRILSFKKNEKIFKEGEECSFVCLVIEGEISIVSDKYLSDGVIFNKVNQSELFGNNLIFSSNPKYKGDVIANKDTTLCFFDKKTLIYLLQNNIEFLLQYLRKQSDFGKNLNNNIKLLSINDASKRLLFYLRINNGTIKYRNVTTFSKELYLSREALSRTLSKLEKENIIQRGKHSIRLWKN